MTLLERIDLGELQSTLKTLGLDGWLLYDFRGGNPVARRVVGLGGLVTRRVYVWLPASGRPVALVHRIELGAVAAFPGEVRSYGSWRELEQQLGALIRGRRVAMEISPDGGVPYLDRVPAGAAKVLERIGAVMTSSALLVSRFAAGWTAAERQDHRAAAEILADTARAVLREAVREAGKATEIAVQRRVRERLEAAGLNAPESPIVAFGAHAANPHYEPREGDEVVLQPGQVVLLDLWARRTRGTVFADQTWMGFAGTSPPDDVARVWEAVRDARDAVLDRLRSGWGSGPLTGADLDDVARGVITSRGYGDAFFHRTGHSIDGDLHGSGPNLDNFETNDTRELVVGLGFSVEPGIYLDGRFGVRSEVNVFIDDAGPQVTPREIQRALITL